MKFQNAGKYVPNSRPGFARVLLGETTRDERDESITILEAELSKHQANTIREYSEEKRLFVA